MAYSITCPHCSAKLKSQTAVPLGRNVKCPKCSDTFVVSAAIMEEVADSKMAVPATSAKPAVETRSASVKKAPPAPPVEANPFGFDDEPAPKSRRDEDDEDEKPRARKKPTPVVDDEEEEERPRARKRRDEDEEEKPRPRKKVLSLDDEDGERPSRYRDDDDDYDTPKKKSKKKKKKGSGIGLKIGLAVAGVLALAGIGYLIYSLFSGGGNYDAEMVSYLPADSTVVGGAEIGELHKNEKFKGLVDKMSSQAGDKSLKDLDTELKPTGLTTADFSRVVFGGSPTGSEPTVVVRTTKAFEKAKLAEVLDCKKEMKKGDKVYYSNSSGKVVYFPSDTMFVLTNDKHFETLSSKESGKVLIPEELQEAAKKMSKGQVWVSISRKVLPTDYASKIDAAKAIRIPYLPPELIDAVKDMKTAGLWAKADGEQVTFGLAMICNKSETAEAAEKAIQKEIDDNKSKNLADNPLMKEAGEMATIAKPLTESLQKSYAVSRSGDMIEVSASFLISDAEKIANAAPAPSRPVKQPIVQPISRPPVRPPVPIKK